MCIGEFVRWIQPLQYQPGASTPPFIVGVAALLGAAAYAEARAAELSGHSQRAASAQTS